MEFRVAIPARYASTRLPGKPLRMIAGYPMLEHVYRRAVASGAKEVIIATDDSRICAIAQGFGADVCMTAVEHSSGTDRLAEVATLRGWSDETIVVNLQGDEPLMPSSLLQQVAVGLDNHPMAGIATLFTRIYSTSELFNEHIVKVVRDAQGYALYFSRAPIPYHRDEFGKARDSSPARLPSADYFRHIGLYAYRAGELRRYAQLPACQLEQVEALEQLRALWYGMRIYVGEASEVPPAGVDTESDLARVEACLAAG